MKVKRILPFIFLGFLAFLFQNCSQAYHGEGSNALSSYGLSVAQKADLIIRSHCVSCHGGSQNQGGVSNIENYDYLVSTGLLVPGNPDASRIVMSVEEGSMPTSYNLTRQEAQILREWVTSVGAPPDPKPTCSVITDKTNIQTGESLTATLVVQGNATSALLNGQSVPVTGGSLTITPAVSTAIGGEVSNPQGTSFCQSTAITVTAPPPVINAPTCTLTASTPANVVPGDPVTLTMVINGAATAATINGQNVSVQNAKLTVNPINNTSYVATVTGSGKTNSCTASVTVKTKLNLSKDEFYRAKIGPNTKSVDDLIVRCTQCHTQNPPLGYAQAPNWLLIIPGDVSGNLARIKKVVNPNTGAIMNLTLLPLNSSLYQFSSGHKPKNPPFTATELQHIKDFVSKP